MIVYGDIYIVEGGYTHYGATHGASMATLVDVAETPGWQRTRLGVNNLDFYKGDFANERFMSALPGPFTSGVAFDVLLHQPTLMHSLHLMLESL